MISIDPCWVTPTLKWTKARLCPIGAKVGDMAKERKPAYELEALIFNEARKARECEGMNSVTVREIADARVDYNWQVSFNATPACAQVIADVVTRLQQRYDLAETE